MGEGIVGEGLRDYDSDYIKGYVVVDVSGLTVAPPFEMALNWFQLRNVLAEPGVDRTD